jgi:glycerophosphoryl diester phosphodiesterase
VNPLLDPAARLVIAHRGNRAQAPENTMESFRQAASIGADALEFDVRMSRDGVPVVVHDPSLDRTTDVRGRVGQYTSQELQGLNAAARFDGNYGRAGVPLLEEVLGEFGKMPLVIEVKELAAAAPTAALIRRMGLVERVLVGSSHDEVMWHFSGTGIAICASSREAFRALRRTLTGRAVSDPPYQVMSITPRYHGIPVPVTLMASRLSRSGIPTHVWTVNDPDRAIAYWRAGVTGIVTDDPAAMIRARAR